MTLAQALADVATIAILRQRTLEQSYVENRQLETALTSRVIIDQIKGGVDTDDTVVGGRPRRRLFPDVGVQADGCDGAEALGQCGIRLGSSAATSRETGSRGRTSRLPARRSLAGAVGHAGVE
ncbi:hypothetical protein [Streptomyces cyaneochromogenes]|uniref:hypothetical protein n=1 Tax=Streptomyces cyaneochromogenes TaxID=2496836 RepID=UPI002B1F530A|nr:hypothetical protein [Streptomyces cyaneochromogenes]